MCEVRWGDPFGPPDTNEIVGHVRLRRYAVQIHGRTIKIGDNDRWYSICATHAAMLKQAGMHNWEFRPLVSPTDESKP